MNINLVYEGKNYNFDIPNGVTIDYLKELSSKIFNSDKALLDLVYNNKKFQLNDDNTLIRDLIPDGEKNVILTVQIHKKIKDKKKDEEIPLVTLKTRSIESNGKEAKKVDEDTTNEKQGKQEKQEKSKRIESNKIIKKSSDKKENHNEELNNSNNNNKNSKSILIINNNKNINILKKDLDIKSFESKYIKKNRELLSLMNEFNNKIKEIYLSLFKKYKNLGANGITNNISLSSNNSSISSIINSSLNNNAFYELTLYEKKVIDFQEKQIKYYKKLLLLIQKYNKDGDFFKLNEFFTNLVLYGINNNIKDNIKDNTKLIQMLKLKKITNNNILSVNNSLLGSSSPKIQKSNLPPLTTKNNNSSIFEKKNNSINLKNNFSSITPIKNKKDDKNANSLNYEKTKDEKTKNINILNLNSPNNNNNLNDLNNLNNGAKSTKSRRSSLFMDGKLTFSKIMNKYLNNKNIETNNSIDLSEKNSINKNNNDSPLKIIKKSAIINYNPKKRRQFSVVNIDKTKNILYNLEKGNGDKSPENKRSSNFRYGSLGPIYNLKNKLNDSPKKSRRITIEKNSPIKIRKNDRNNSILINNVNNNKKITNIDVSSMTVNDSNFGRDKTYIKAKKIKKGINKFDFFM